MATTERGLGSGLDSLLRSTRNVDLTKGDIQRLGITQIVPGGHQPRKVFDEDALQELSVSIRNQGVVQPLIVRPKQDTSPLVYEIVAGERRWRAAKLAGLVDVPVIISSYSDDEAVVIALVENLQRENLNALEEAEALQALKDKFDLNQDELAQKIGRSRSSVANALRLLNLPADILDLVAHNKLNAGSARSLLSISHLETQQELAERIINHKLSVRDVESSVDYWKRHNELPPLPTTGKAQPRPRAKKPESLAMHQMQLREVGYTNATLGGTENSGKLVLHYSSNEELLLYLRRLQSE